MASEMGTRRPKYQRIADDLKAAIESGEYGPGDRLPGESALATQYDVAVLTARQALKILRIEGLVETKKGAGARVIEFHPIRRHGIQRIAREQWGTGRSIWSADEERPTTIDVHVDTVAAPAHIAHMLELDEDALVCTRSRRIAVADRPVLLATSYLPLELVEETAIMRVDTGEGGTYARLAELGHQPTHFREEIRCRLPLAEEAEGLAMPLGRPVIKLCRTAFDSDLRAVEVNEMTMDSAAYVLEYAFDA
ncbi:MULTISPECIES: GntR family transcriptional regulator [Streptomyces]|uniref:GntR family transcriptional regulator n=3 Tax=Streptomyces rimosus TaxID=1927 RepID=L8F069_STRR1|nr:MULTISPECIES: GntR family transcriptional regulator [Streptomyces]KOG73096.1 GntR family transcriptional regulator [Kitasatospora aureofaciens]MYT42046.1 UTRA domain-containing protein [Streptomyces sp. SID5471]KEF04867.1 GntR family transcriptional regulator [Streptomyces rimosus]KOT38642.1 GntR family transcriptional regulator [Streptomyces rimosus subsp. rimosus]KOT38743.1 GntR family transcriptional regulator [Streptomyces sp. NRRL WC-3701]